MSEMNEEQNEFGNITFVHQGTEIMRVAPEGFYIRGDFVSKSAEEGEQVYAAFKEFLRNSGYLV